MKAFFVVNPRSGGGRRLHQLDRAIALVRSLGWEVDSAETGGKGEGTALARAAARDGWDVVVACGGDGTTNEVIQPLVGTRTALGVLPLGTANVFARQERVPLDLMDAARALATGSVRELDVGVVDGHYFLLWVGLGFDAEVVRAMEGNQAPKKRWGVAAFVVAALRLGIRYRPHRARLHVDGRVCSRDILLLLVCNARTYALMEVARQARMDDGKLDVLVFEGRGIPTKLCHAVRILLHRHCGSAPLEYFQTTDLIVQAANDMPAQVDGEPFDRRVTRVGVMPRALRVILPRSRPIS